MVYDITVPRRRMGAGRRAGGRAAAAGAVKLRFFVPRAGAARRPWSAQTVRGAPATAARPACARASRYVVAAGRVHAAGDLQQRAAAASSCSWSRPARRRTRAAQARPAGRRALSLTRPPRDERRRAGDRRARPDQAASAARTVVDDAVDPGARAARSAASSAPTAAARRPPSACCAACSTPDAGEGTCLGYDIRRDVARASSGASAT
ncbi:MAG: hypothetical protein MZW92_56040 [Comamonadaceae bacterium]|nr:hypothetical protein [Comamonadaceae bacterium]